MTALALVTGMTDMYDIQVDVTRQEGIFYQRVLGFLSGALYHTRTLLEAYDYYLARCAEAGLTAEQAHTAWQIHSSPEFEAEIVEAESYGPNALRMIDEQVLRPLGIGPHAPEEEP
jgi:hypothetical protein